MSKQNQYLELEKEIKSCIHKAVSKTNQTVFESLNDVFKTYFERPSHNISEIKTKTTKQKGLVFEIFCKMYLLARGYDDVWLLSEIPKEVREYLNMVSFDIGIDLVARMRIPSKNQVIFDDEADSLDKYFYFPIQAKYRKPTKNKLNQTVHRVGWKEVSTFLALVGRTGPPKGWLQHIIMTNADNVCWRGKKTKKDKTYAKKTFEKCSNMFWLDMISKGNQFSLSVKYCSDANKVGTGHQNKLEGTLEFESDSENEELGPGPEEKKEIASKSNFLDRVNPSRNINNLRKQFLDNLMKK